MLVDTTAPTIESVSFASSNTSSDPDLDNTLLAMADDTLTLSFTTDERVEDVEVMINGSSYSATDTGSGMSWEVAHTVASGGDAEEVEFEITSFSDPSGNALVSSETHTSDDSGYSVLVDTPAPPV